MKCTVCNEEDIRIKFQKDSWYISKCNSCGYEFIFPRTNQEKLSEEYNKNKISPTYYYIENYSEDKKMFNDRYKKIKDYIPQKGVLLDIGCNIGTCSEVFHENGWDIYAIDINKSSIDYLKDKPFKLFNCLVEELNLWRKVIWKCH